MGRPRRRHIADPFRRPFFLCGLVIAATITDGVEPCRRCAAQAEAIRTIVRVGREHGTLAVPCAYCVQPVGWPCLDIERRVSSPHAQRWRIVGLMDNPPTKANDERVKLKLVLDGDPVQDARSSDRPSAPPQGEASP